MDDRLRSTTRTAVLCGFLLLAFAVFAWGLHAKLSLYHPGVVPSNATVAKLLVKQRPGPVLATPNERPTPPAGFELLAALSALILPATSCCRRAESARSAAESWTYHTRLTLLPSHPGPRPALSCAR